MTYRRLQAHVDFLAETGRGTIEVPFDDLNWAVGEIDRLSKLLKDLLDPPDDAAMYDAMVAARAYFSELK